MNSRARRLVQDRQDLACHGSCASARPPTTSRGVSRHAFFSVPRSSYLRPTNPAAALCKLTCSITRPPSLFESCRTPHKAPHPPPSLSDESLRCDRASSGSPCHRASCFSELESWNCGAPPSFLSHPAVVLIEGTVSLYPRPDAFRTAAGAVAVRPQRRATVTS